MKKFILVMLVSVFCITKIYAQKIYSTKTGSITFFSETPLEDIEAKNNGVESKLATSNGQIVFLLLIKGFQFDNRLMQEHFNENYMESDKYPKSDFKGFITNIKAINFSKDGVYPANAKGKLTIHGVTKEIESKGTIEVKGGKVTVKSSFNIKLKDYSIGGSLVGDKVAESIKVNVECKYD